MNAKKLTPRTPDTEPAPVEQGAADTKAVAAFKVGDVVRVTSSVMFREGTVDTIGTVGTVIEAVPSGEQTLFVKLSGGAWFNTNELEHVTALAPDTANAAATARKPIAEFEAWVYPAEYDSEMTLGAPVGTEYETAIKSLVRKYGNVNRHVRVVVYEIEDGEQEA